MGPAHCTSGATYCSEISSTLAWGRKVPSVRGVPREGSTRVLSAERLCTSREVLRTLLPFRPRAIWRLRLKARERSRSYTLHYSSCSTRRITQAHLDKKKVFKNYKTPKKNWIELNPPTHPPLCPNFVVVENPSVTWPEQSNHNF